MKRIAHNRSTPEDFWRKVDIRSPTECWPWTGAIAHGYGSLSYQGNSYRAHRLAWQLTHNITLPRLRASKTTPVVMHACDNRACCNPAHLSLGTYLENRRDCVAKGRDNSPRGDANGSRRRPDRLKRGDDNVSRKNPELLVRGSAHHKATLTENQVLTIRQRAAAGERNVSIARDFGITGALVWKIKTRRIWRHI